MQTEGPDPGRSPLREVSNAQSPAPNAVRLSAPNSIGKPGFDADATPPPTVWQSGDDYKFVEEDDDEVMFRMRDSGVLRSLANPGLVVNTPPAVFVAGDSTQDKQVKPSSRQLTQLTDMLCIHHRFKHAVLCFTGQVARTAPDASNRCFWFVCDEDPFGQCQ
jgi:hypothetical protein